MIGYDKFAVVHLLSHVWLCDSTACSMQGFPVLHYLQEFAQTHIHWIRDAIQPSHPFLPASPPGSVWPGLNLSLLISFPSLHHGWSRAMEKWFSTQMFLSQMAKTMAAIIASPLCLDCTDVPTNQGSQSTVFCAIWEAWPAEIHSCEDEAETSPSSWRAFGAERAP